MATIIRNLPYFREQTRVTVRGRAIAVHSFQTVLWVSVCPQGLRTFDPNTPRFPAVLDIGFTHNFLMREDQLIQWAGLRTEHLRELGHIKPHGQRVPLRAANVWLHRNRAGQRDEFEDTPPFCIELDSGIGLCPSAMARAPRLPLLGQRGLWCAELQSSIDRSSSLPRDHPHAAEALAILVRTQQASRHCKDETSRWKPLSTGWARLRVSRC